MLYLDYKKKVEHNTTVFRNPKTKLLYSKFLSS